jgi:NAD(P)H-hydrate epimerase
MMDKKPVPYLLVEEMIEVDRLMVDHYGIQLVQMMENAGRHLAELARERFLDKDPRDKKIIILAGSGGNGGGAMVSARNLHNWGADVELFLTKSIDQLRGTINHQVRINQQLGIRANSEDRPPSSDQLPDLIIDGIIGYSLVGAPQGRAADLINWANDQKSPILALDLPSGLHASTGEVFSPAIRAAATMTLALPKKGLETPSQPVVGELYLADIGVPPELYSQPSININVGPIFSDGPLIRLF